MAYVTLFVPQPVLDMPTHGTIQYHPSLLPRHRGPSSINWPIAMGEKRDRPLDLLAGRRPREGAVLLQKTVDDRPRRDARRRLLQEAVPDGRRRDDGVGRPRQSRQGAAHQAGPRRRRPTKSWFKTNCRDRLGASPGAEIDNLIRAANPAPGAWSTIERQEARDLRRQACRQGPQGHRRQARRDRRGRTPTGITDRLRATAAILVKRVQPADGKKIAAGEWVKTAGVNGRRHLRQA